MSLKAPKLVVIDEIIELLGNRRPLLFVRSCFLKLFENMLRQVLETRTDFCARANT
jgi:hypothetical protein